MSSLTVGRESVQLVDTWEGRGSVQLLQGDKVHVHYEIDLWRIADNAIVGRGYIEGDVEAMLGLRKAQGPLTLSLADGVSLNAIVVERGGGRTWTAIYVPRPIPDVIPAVWPTNSAGQRATAQSMRAAA
jgi:hypothetical protein